MYQQNLSHQWGIWIIYSSDTKQQASKDYHDNTELLFQVKTIDELAFVWNNTKISSLDEYFTNLKTSKLLKFVENQQIKKKVDAICFFRSPFEPSWEYGDNSKGGQFSFFFNKDTQIDLKNIYEYLVFSIISEHFSLKSDIVGIRFVDRAKVEALVKGQIWVQFNDENGKDRISEFTQEFINFCNQIKLKILQLSFRNNNDKK